MAGQMEQLPVFIDELTHEKLDRFLTEFDEWASMPRGIDLPNDSIERRRAMRLSDRASSEAVETFVTTHDKEREVKTAEGNYKEAMRILGHAYTRAADIFQGEELTMAQLQTLRGMGQLYMEKAQIDEDPATMYTDLLNASLGYMTADRRVGCITPAGVYRMFEITLAPELRVLHDDVQDLLLGKGAKVTVLYRGDYGAMAIVESLRRKAVNRGLPEGETPQAFVVRRGDIPNAEEN